MDKLSAAQTKRYQLIGTIFIALVFLSFNAERWTVFLPSAAMVRIRWVLYAIYFLLLAALILRNKAWLRRSQFKDFAGVLGGLLLFTWGLGQCTYNMVGLSNAATTTQATPIELVVLDNLSAPEGLVSREHSIFVFVRSDPDKEERLIRYRYRQLALRGVPTGATVCVLARPGWAGYTLERLCKS